ncbi:uncharacterized protein LOC108092194 [Drosophila ficusphila]|uniref:uncharacterized protein LOC108092194 n=1 Tax=Drosophila ficusphila TaxID=30025 RepID=UPI0007E7E47A|nr:uncharacterized protein LOC108092194 [Drosophila ficusphila]
MEGNVNFLLDFAATHVEVFGVKFENPSKLMVTTKLAAGSQKVTSSRLNVSDFVANREMEISSDPLSLRRGLEEKGMSMSVNYQGATLGGATMTFPMEFLDKISSTMNDLLLQETLDLNRRADVVGTISIILRLTLKCEEQAALQPLGESVFPGSKMSLIVPKKERSSCASQAPNINPQDVMFLFGDPDPLLQIPSEPCSELRVEIGDERLELDLQRYKSRENRRAIFPEDDRCPQEKPSFGKLKRLIHEYSTIIDSVAEKVKRLDCPSSSMDLTGTNTTDPTPRTPMHTPRIPGQVPKEPCIKVPLRADDDHGIKPIRFCPTCLCSMSWMPKYMPCPKCNIKAFPVLPDELNKKQTADEIMNKLLVRPKPSPGFEDFCEPVCEKLLRQTDECAPCRCTCKKGKMCAHCRIRKLCEDIYDKKAPPPPEKPRPEPRSDEDFCVLFENEEDDMPYLSKVFYELKNLYHLHDTKKLTAIKERCEAKSLFSIHSRRSTKEIVESLYQSDRSLGGVNHPPKKGHKKCVPSSSFVSRRHGWNWKSSCEARINGWRPGSILRASCLVMRHFLMNHEHRKICPEACAEFEEKQRYGPPVLNVCKRNGEIFITLRALPTLDMKQDPITFRIVKSDLAVALRQMKRSLKKQGFEKCTCHKSLMLCTCRDALDKVLLNRALKKECQKRLMEPCPEHLVLTDTSISDVEFDLNVTPPAGTWKPKRKALRNVVNHGTQTGLEKIPKVPRQYPVPHDPYWRAVDCAVGDRYMGTAFGSNVENVFEDGVFGYRRGGQHGKPVVWKHPTVWGKNAGAPLRIGTARDRIDPSRFTKSVWKGLPRKIICKMQAKSKY